MEGQVGPATKALIAINVVIGLVMLSDTLWSQMVFAGGLFPVRLTQGSAGFEGFLLPAIVTPFSAAFMHGGLGHLMLNMMMLLVMGRFVEQIYGWRIFLFLYFAAIVISTFVEVVVSPTSSIPTVGASGAISGVIAAYVTLLPREKPEDMGPIPAKIARPLKLFVGWVALNFMMRFVAVTYGINIAIWSHIGGFTAGLLLAHPLLRYKYRHA